MCVLHVTFGIYTHGTKIRHLVYIQTPIYPIDDRLVIAVSCMMLPRSSFITPGGPRSSTKERNVEMRDEASDSFVLHKDDCRLLAAGFESAGGNDDLWKKAGVFFGREAALQCAWRQEQRERKEEV
jgi:hypothetical protein